MAYYCLQATCTSAADLLSNLETALVAFGWTLHDNVSATQKVYKSNGEGADQPYGYIEIYTDASNVRFRA